MWGTACIWIRFLKMHQMSGLKRHESPSQIFKRQILYQFLSLSGLCFSFGENRETSASIAGLENFFHVNLNVFGNEAFVRASIKETVCVCVFTISASEPKHAEVCVSVFALERWTEIIYTLLAVRRWLYLSVKVCVWVALWHTAVLISHNDNNTRLDTVKIRIQIIQIIQIIQMISGLKNTH